MACSTEETSTIAFSESTSALAPDDYLLKNKSMYEFITSYFSDLPKDRIHLSTPVKRIEYARNKVKILSTKNETFEFNKVVLSVPLSQLKKRKIEFVPDLPKEKKDAIDRTGMGTGLKAFFFFKEKIVLEKSKGIKLGPYYSSQKLGSKFALVTLLMGHFSEAYYKSPESYQNKMLKEISSAAGKDVSSLLEGSVFQDWGNEPFIEGTYSFPHIREKSEDRKIASEPIDKTVFFIGEGMNTEYGQGLIHGAMETALKVSKVL